MKMRLIIILFLYLFHFPVSLIAQDIPERPVPPRLVNDFVSLLSESQLNALESKLRQYHDTTTTQIAVVIIPTTNGYPVSEYAFELGEAWGVGQKGTDNGVVILVATDDRDLFIATGYGMEGVLPDAYVKQIVENYMKPAFREGAFYEGIDAATSQIILLAAGEYQGTPPRKSKPAPWFIILLILFFFLFPFFRAYRNASQYAAMNDVPLWTAWILLNQARRTHQGRYSGWSSGGGFGGGGSSFGGFGGGSFGGGGAGGSW